VISAGALTPILVCFHKLEITPLSNFNHPRDGTVLGDVETNRDSVHGGQLLYIVASLTTTLWHINARERGPSTPSTGGEGQDDFARRTNRGKR
jgi:hypothetical protein